MNIKRNVLLLLPFLLSFAQAGEPVTFHSLAARTITGEVMAFSQLEGRVVLIVNTASKCGFTRQYADLVDLEKAYAEQGLTILAFPSDNFGNQELDTHEEIAAFCEAQFDINFPLMEKTHVRGEQASPLFKMLTEASNDGFTGPIRWNFEKFLLDANGALRHRFRSNVSPDSPPFRQALEALLAEANATP